MMSRDDISCVPCKLTASGASTSRSRIANAKYQSSLECSTPRTAGVYGVNSWAVNTSTHIIPSRTSFQYIYIYISLVTSGSKDQFTKNTHTHEPDLVPCGDIGNPLVHVHLPNVLLTKIQVFFLVQVIETWWENHDHSLLIIARFGSGSSTVPLLVVNTCN